MTVGTQGFIGERLRDAREARGLSAIALSELTGVTRQAIHQFERGTDSPRPDTMARIGDVLRLPPLFFKTERPPRGQSTVFYRSLSSATRTARTRAERRYEWLSMISSYAETLVEFPALNLPDLNPPKDPHALHFEDIERLAGEVRKFWQLGDGPISNLVWLLENNGVVVARDELGAETLDAFSSWPQTIGRPFVFLAADKASCPRSRFDAAHELAHLLLHRHLDPNRARHPVEFKLIEAQAHRFAGAFLFPAASFRRAFYMPSLDSLRKLKSQWVLSIGMMIHRSEDLGLVSQEQGRRLWIAYSRRGWRSAEPLDDLLPVEEPRLVRRAVELIVKSGVRSTGEILEALPLAPDDIERLASLDSGFMSGVPVQRPAPIRFRSVDKGQEEDQSVRGDLLFFPRRGQQE